MGIPEEEQERIFEDFYQLSNFARDASKGLGLGLSIVQRTARLLGHPIGINTRRRGSVFTITVPLAPAGSDSQTILQTDPSGPSYPTTAVTILLVEDDDIVRKAMAMMLDSSVYRVIAATGGTEALSEIRDATRVPDIIVTDYRLAGGETGPQVIEAVHGILGTDVPALILTGDVELTDVPGMSDRVFPILKKPVAPDSLRSEIQRLLAEHP